MCDYSLHNARSRPAVVGEKLTTRNFGTGTRGFASPEDATTAVCLLPGTELAFDAPIQHYPLGYGSPEETTHRTAIFRQIHKELACTHHDAIEFPDGKTQLLTSLVEYQVATVLQLPAAPKTEQEAKDQERLAVTA